MTIGGAIAELQNLINADDVPFYYKGGIKKVIETISMELPPTERTGEWIVHPLIDDGCVELECSECGDTFVRAVDYKPDFCENCGADMRGDKE